MARHLTFLAATLVVVFFMSTVQCGISPSASGSVRGDTVLVDDFEADGLTAWVDGVDLARHRIVTDSAGAQSGRRFLEVTYVAGGDGGWLTRFFMPGYDSLYVSYYVRFPAGWQGDTKLIGLYGSRTDDQWSALGKAGTCPTGSDFFATMLVAEAAGNPGPMRFYTYYPAMAREPDGVTCWGRFGDGTEIYAPPLALSPAVWHHVEFWVKLNAPDQANAAQTFWLDGVQRGTWSGISLRRTKDLRLNALQLSFNRGTLGGVLAQRLHVDHLTVTTIRPAR
jgi:hypothetical protein